MMSNLSKARPDVDLELGGRKLRLRFNLAAMADVEDKCGKPATALLAEGSLKGVMYLIWAACQKYHPEVKITDIGDWVDMQNMASVMQVLLEALSPAKDSEEVAETATDTPKKNEPTDQPIG